MKRVLIINATAIGENKGTGVTLRNIWKDYPRDKILQLIIDWNETEKDSDIRTIRTPIEFCRIPYTFYLKTQKKRKQTCGISNGSIKQKGLKACIHDLIRGMLDVFPVNYDSIIEKVKVFEPDIIYTCGPSVRVLKTVNYISDSLGIPVILHLMDNWPETIYTTSPLSYVFHSIMKKYLKKINQKSIVNLAISDALGRKYSTTYGVEYKMLMNPAIHIENKIHHIDNDAKFLYAGSLNLNRWKSLIEIAKVIDFYQKKGNNLKFTLYVPQNDIDVYAEKFLKYGAVLKPYVSAEKLKKIYQENDILVFAESFDKEIIDFAKYSLSTKIPEYMATGHLILAYLPEELYSSKYLKENKLAVVVSKPEELIVAVKKIISLPEKYYILTENSLKKAYDFHSMDACQKILCYAIKNTCDNYRVK